MTVNYSNGKPIDLSCYDLTKPIVLSNLHGTYDCPIVVTCKDKISVNTFGRCPKEAANRIAYLKQENGFYPSVSQVADQAALALVNCQFVVLYRLEFDECWPGALYLNNCQNIVVIDCNFGASTIAIGANGIDTRDIWIEKCSFQQTKDRFLWDEVSWDQVHGSFNNSKIGGVNQNDHRQFDGDFFRAWDIAGNVTIRDCDIVDAYNGIHFFNSVDDLVCEPDRSMVQFNNGRRSASNILIENNRFKNVRDNCIEPEDYAWNWVVRSNTFDNCYAPYSFELKRAGWFYIYDNHYWLDKPAEAENRTLGPCFKLDKEHKNEGDFYIFNNSWLCVHGQRFFKKNTIGKMKHFNNVIKYNICGIPRLFGNSWDKLGKTDIPPKIIDRKGFTKDWDEHEIEMNGDWITNSGGVFDLNLYRQAGYKLGLKTVNKDPGFNKATQRPGDKEGHKWLEPSSDMQSSGIAWTMRLPGYDEVAKEEKNKDFLQNYEITIPASKGVGAGMSEKQLNFFKKMLRFVPECPIAPDIKNKFIKKTCKSDNDKLKIS